MPRTLVQKVGVLFPFTNFLRLDNEMEMTSTCGGISAIIAILLVLAIFISELVSVFSMNKITSSSESSLSLQPPMVNITTYQNDTQQIPYMVGISYFQDNFYRSSANQSARYIHIQGSSSSGNRTLTETNITLQTCTTQHFSVIPGIQQKQNTWGISNWLCLPINQTWTIGGDYELSSDYRRIDINMTCFSAQNFVDCGYYKVYTLNSFVNPSDPISPITYYLSQDTVLVKAQAYYQYSSKLNQNNLTIDESVTPLARLVSRNSFEAIPASAEYLVNKARSFRTVYKIQSSGRVTFYNRTFYKLLAALSFVGGIFNSILAIFFFMIMFMRFMFEMRFAEYYFNNDEARDVGFFAWIRQAIFSVVQGTFLQPDWDVTEKRLNLRQTVNKVLDIFYLHKRIAFLEKAISVVLDRHQLKGLHLAQNISKEDSDQKINDYKLRDRVVTFLNKYRKTAAFKENDDNNGSEKEMRGEGIASSNNLGGNQVRIQPVASRNVRLSTIQHEAEMEDYEDERSRIERMEVERILEHEVRNIGEMPEEELNEDGLVDQMGKDLAKLFQQGQNLQGNQNSRKICHMLEGWLMQGLKLATKERLFTRHLIRRGSNGANSSEEGERKKD